MNPPVLLPIASTRETVAGTWALVRRRRLRLWSTLVVLPAGTAAGLLVPYLLGAMVDAVVEQLPVARLVWLTGALLVSGTIAIVLIWWGQRLLARLAQTALADLREEVFDAAVAQPASVIEEAGTGDLVSRISGDTDAVNTVIGGVLPAFLSALFTVTLTLAGLGAVDWRFLPAVLLATPLQWWALRSFLRRSGPVYRSARAADAARSQRIIESVGGAQTVSALRRTGEHIDDIAAASEYSIGHDLAAMRLRTIFFGRLNIAELIGLAAVLASGFWLFDHGAVTLGAATAAAIYFHNLFGPIGVLLATVDDLQNAGAGLSRLIGVTMLGTAKQTAAQQQSDSEAVPEFRPGSGLAISARGVSFSYGHRVVVDDLTLQVEPGERVAVIGASGAGKSTLAKVLAGIHPAQAGSVTIGGAPIGGLTPAELRTRVILVSQESHVFVGTVRENLQLFAPSATDGAIGLAISRLDAGWVQDLPDGLDTVVGEGGVTLNAGQAQHLALIRLVLADPAVVILDEATAEAGTAQAAELERAAEQALAGRTGVVIAHRLSQAQHADRVVVMEAGRMVEIGSHDELLAADGRYAEFWSAWERGRRRSG